MKRTWIVLGCWLGLIGGVCGQARAQLPSGPIQMHIVGAEQVSPIAVSALKNLAGDDDHKVSDVFIATLRRDLKLAGFFRLIDPSAYVEDAQSSGFDVGQFNFADWSSLNAEFLVKGGVRRDGANVSVEAMLFDVGQQRRMMGRKFTGMPREVGEMARRFADALIQSVTGTRGPFASRLAFVSTRGGRFKEVYTSWLDGGSMFRVTDNPTINLFPSFDKSASHLLYLSYKTMSPALYVVDLAHSVETRVDSPRGMPVGGTLTGDGRIVAAFSRAGKTNLYLLDQGGAELRALTDNPAINVNPAVCKAGNQMAFASDRSGNPQIYLMDLASGEAHRLTYKGDYNTAPAFSPDCKKIVYEGRTGGVFQIFVTNTDGSGTRQLTNEGSNESPTWSPDGRYIAFSSKRHGSARLYMLLVAEGKITGALTEEEDNDSNPSWSGWIDG